MIDDKGVLEMNGVGEGMCDGEEVKRVEWGELEEG